VGRTLRLNGHPFTVIGVAASRYRGLNALARTAAWVPAWMFDALMEVPPTASILEDRGSMFNVLARMKPGVSLARAQAALDIEAARLAREYPSTHKDVALRVVPETHARPTPEIGPFLRVATTALTGLTLVLLLITSANVTGLLMARAASRGREVALRAALGARRGRIARQLLTEALVLSLVSGALAVPLAVFAVRGLHGLIAGASSVVTIDPDLSIDLRVLAVTFATAITAGIVSGLAPALVASRVDVATALKSSGRGASRGPTSRA
jgi:ABC-type antimicrobial peptide transport system permease subunit